MLLLCLFSVVLLLGFFGIVLFLSFLGIMLLFGFFSVMPLLRLLRIVFLLGLFSIMLLLRLLVVVLLLQFSFMLLFLLRLMFLLLLSFALLPLLSLMLQLVLLRMLPSLLDPNPSLLLDLAPMCRALTHLGNAIVGGGFGTHVPLGDLAARVEVDFRLPLVLDDDSRDSREGRAAPFGRGDGFTGDFADGAWGLSPAPLAAIEVCPALSVIWFLAEVYRELLGRRIYCLARQFNKTFRGRERNKMGSDVRYSYKSFLSSVVKMRISK